MRLYGNGARRKTASCDDIGFYHPALVKSRRGISFMGKKENQPCYYCGVPGSSEEHIPPRCFFPDGDPLRKAVIKVPSGSDHNNLKSDDDEYLLAVIAGSIGVNEMAIQNTRYKTLRAIKKHKKPRETFYKDLKPVVFAGMQTGAFALDTQRFDGILSRIARGLYYHEYGNHWVPEIRIAGSMLLGTEDTEIQNLRVIEMFRAAMQLLDGKPWKGEEQRIFRYNITRDVAAVQLLVVMDFYEGFP